MTAKISKPVYSIQVLRAVSAILVVLRHIARRFAEGNGGYSFEIGQCGVDIFFVISGFVIYYTGKNLAWSDFVRRRFARVVPLYWLVLGVAVALSMIRGTKTVPLSNIVFSLFFVPSHDQAGGVFPPISVGWSLNFEAWFYLLFAIVLATLPRTRPLIPVSLLIALGCIIGPAALDVVNPNVVPAALLLLPISLEFVAGMWIAERWMAGMHVSPWWAAVIFPAAIAWFAVAPTATAYTIARPLYWGVPATAIVWAALSLERTIDFGRWRAALVIGDASYAIYLTHQLVLPVAALAVDAFAPSLPVAAMFVVLLVAAVAAGVGAHFAVELPLLSWTNRLMRFRSPVARAGADSVHLQDANATRDSMPLTKPPRREEMP